MAKGLVFGGLNAGGSNVKSVQAGYGAADGANKIFDIPISPIIGDYGITVYPAGMVRAARFFYSASIIGGNTLRLEKNSNYWAGQPFFWEIIEFQNTKSFQTGSYALTTIGGFQKVNITPVNPLKSRLFFTYNHTNDEPEATNVFVLGKISDDGTGVEFQVATATANINYQVVEFN